MVPGSCGRSGRAAAGLVRSVGVSAGDGSADRGGVGSVVARTLRDVDLDLGVLRVTSTLIRVTGQGLLRKCTKSQAGERICSCRSGA